MRYQRRRCSSWSFDHKVFSPGKEKNITHFYITKTQREHAWAWTCASRRGGGGKPFGIKAFVFNFKPGQI